jgi:hypothetical protein
MSRKFVAASSQYLSGTPGLTALPMTLACWFQIAASGTHYVLGGVFNSTTTYMILNYDSASSGAVGAQGIMSSSGGELVNNGTTFSTLNTWAHCAGSFSLSGSNLTVNNYFNGAHKASGTAATGAAVAFNNAQIGAFATPSLYHNGLIAEFGCWNVVLSDAEVAALGAGALPSTVRPNALVGYWPLNGLVSPEPDLSGQAHNMTLHNTPLLAAGPPVALFTPRIRYL